MKKMYSASRGLRSVLFGLATVLCFGLVPMLSGCSRPSGFRLTGEGRFQDLTKVRRGMSPNEVRRVMGSNYNLIWREGLQGIDMGRYAWEYPSGAVWFERHSVFKVVPADAE